MAIDLSRLWRRPAALLVAVLTLATALDFAVLDHGDPGLIDRNVDTLHPIYTLDLARELVGEFPLAQVKYPPLLFRVVAGAQRAWMFATIGADESAAYERALVERCRQVARGEIDVVTRDDVALHTGRLIVIGRAVVAAFGVALVLAVFLFARVLLGPWTALVAALLVSLCSTVVHYAHQVNVDVPYVALAMFAVWLVARAIRFGRAGDLVLAAGCAGLAIATKDQAYGLFVLVVPVVLWLYARPGALAPGVTRRVPWRACLLAAFVGVLPFAICPGIPIDVAWHREHIAFLLGAGSAPFREVPLDLAGTLRLAWITALVTADGISWLAVGTACVGFVLLVRSSPRTALLLALPALSYVVTFLVPVGYVPLRYALPLQCIAVVCAAHAITLGLAARRFRVVAACGLIAIVAWNVESTARVLRLLAQPDTRAEAEQFLREHYPPTTSMLGVLAMNGVDVVLPPWPGVTLASTNDAAILAANHADVVVLCSFDATQARDRTAFARSPSPPTIELGSEYRLARTFRASIEHSMLLGAPIHPTILVYERVIERRP